MTVHRPTVAIVGPGSVAELHVDALRRSGARVVAVVGRTASQAGGFAERHGIPRHYDDLASVLGDEQVDGAVICGPSQVHLEHLTALHRAGVAVLVEVPPISAPDELSTLTALLQTRPARAYVALTERYMKPVRLVRRQIAEGTLRPSQITLRWAMPRMTNTNWAGRRRSWTDDVLWHHGLHALDLVLWWLHVDSAELVDVRASLWMAERPIDFQAILQIGEASCSLSLSYAASEVTHDCLVVGEGSSLRVDFTHRTAVPRQEAKRLLVDGLRLQDDEFVQALRGSTTTLPSLTDLVPTLGLLREMADRLAGAGQRRRLPAFD